MAQEAWAGFKGRIWKEDVNVRDFIQHNYEPYDGDESFLVGPTEATDKLWGELQKLQKEERAKGGVLDMETKVVSGLTADSQVITSWSNELVDGAEVLLAGDDQTEDQEETDSQTEDTQAANESSAAN